MPGDEVQNQVAEAAKRSTGALMNWRFCVPARSPAIRGHRRWCCAVGAEALPQIAW